MAGRSVEQLRWIRLLLLAGRLNFLRVFRGVRIGERVVISLSARLVCNGRASIQIGNDSLIAFKTLITTMSEANARECPVKIGERCFVGGGSIVAPGVTIGDDCIVGAGSVVLESIPAGSLVGGNPARIIRSGLTIHRARGQFLFEQRLE